MTRWKIIFPIFGHLLQWKYAQWPHKIPKVGSKIGQILNKPSVNYQRLWPNWRNFANSGHTEGIKLVNQSILTTIGRWVGKRWGVNHRDSSNNFVSVISMKGMSEFFHNIFLFSKFYFLSKRISMTSLGRI